VEMRVADELLVVGDLHHKFGGVLAVDGCSISVPTGSITGLIGPNGAGKTTLVNVVSGALKLQRGRVVFDGSDIAGWSAHRIARRGLVRTFQLSREFRSLTVLENLLVAAPNQRGERFLSAVSRPWIGRDDDRRLVAAAMEVLERFRLAASCDEYARNLSGGQKRLLELGRAVMSGASLVLLDEPMAGISPALIEELLGHLEELRRDGVSFVMVEHNLLVVERVCDHVIVMAEGKALASGRMEDLRRHPEVIRAYLGGTAA
jgi:ABC-type branched-subunit amino acid transport system ATPase component